MHNTENSAAILRESAYDKGYKDGVTCGRLCASQQLLDALEELLAGMKTDYEQKLTDSPDKIDTEAEAYWRGGSVTCFKLLSHIKMLKKKYEVL